MIVHLPYGISSAIQTPTIGESSLSHLDLPLCGTNTKMQWLLTEVAWDDSKGLNDDNRQSFRGA